MEAVISYLIMMVIDTSDVSPLIAFMLTCKWANSCSLRELRCITAHDITGLEIDFMRDLYAAGPITDDIVCQFLLIKPMSKFKLNDKFFECVVRNFSMDLVNAVMKYVGNLNYRKFRVNCSFIAIYHNYEESFKRMVDCGFFIETERVGGDLSSYVGCIIDESRINMLKYLCMSNNYDIFDSIKDCNIVWLKSNMEEATLEMMQILVSRCAGMTITGPDDIHKVPGEVHDFFMHFYEYRRMMGVET